MLDLIADDEYYNLLIIKVMLIYDVNFQCIVLLHLLLILESMETVS